MEAEADRTAFVNIGIGLNVNNDPTRSAPNAVSMRRLLGREVPRKEVLAVFLDRLETMLADGLGPELIEQWRAVNATLGRAVKVETAWQRVEGTAVDVDENGALIVETRSGERETIFYGDCFHLGNGKGAVAE
jgi:BirA family biotin operon repressor/biotin-[acetyl-CoA-carboxylase] ligase